jgi:transcriptional regulator with XRE-family HTH domain
MHSYPDLLKEWRKRRRMSQLDLAVEADVSARHISFLETGRSRPSADMIVHLSEVMDVPTEARNQMMRSVGFAPRYGATPLSEDAMAPIREAVGWTLERHAPYPGIVLDRLWRVVLMNVPASRLFAPMGIAESDSLLDLFTNPVMSQVVENWPEVAHYTSLRLRAESVAAGGIAELDAAVAVLAPQARAVGDGPPQPAIPTVYRFGEHRLSLLGTIAQFSTVADETLDDLKVELFFPADACSRRLLEDLGSGL